MQRRIQIETLALLTAQRFHSMYGVSLCVRMSASNILTKKSVSSGLAAQMMQQQSRVAASLPVAVNLSPTCRACTEVAIAQVWATDEGPSRAKAACLADSPGSEWEAEVICRTLRQHRAADSHDSITLLLHT